uniref:methyl-accepting chemotaxis protein n=1 Tax=Agathobacter sp. TaxID=2021311 RepID=UPI00405773D6
MRDLKEKNTKQKKKLDEISKSSIYKFMIGLTIGVASVFFIKNLLGANMSAAIAVGCVLIAFCTILFIMGKINAVKDTKYMISSVAIIVVICVISIFSGDSLSDDFILHMAAIALAGLYLRPTYSRIQLITADCLLVMQMFVTPQKVGKLSQFLMCLGLFNLTGILFSLVVARGRAYIAQSRAQAAAAQKVIESLALINAELNRNFEVTHGRISDMNNASQQVELRTNELMDDSLNITTSVDDTMSTCNEAESRIEVCKSQIQTLMDNVQHFEEVLKANEHNIGSMSSEIITIRDSSNATNKVFDGIHSQMEEIVNVVSQLKSIAASTNMLSLNASIEAARAGSAGAGFAVVAEKVQQLAIDSNRCSDHVEQIVNSMQLQVDKTRKQLAESTETVEQSLASIDELNNSFEKLLQNFTELYSNISEQDQSVTDLADSFVMIQNSVSTMADYSNKNQLSINQIADAVKIYGSNMEQMEQDTENLHKLAETMEREISG